MNRLMSSLAVAVAASLAQGCATSQPTQHEGTPGARMETPRQPPRTVGSNGTCLGPQCAAEVLRVAEHTEVPVQKDVPEISGHPLTSVVVTQCNLIVAVYLTMQDGSLLRFDSHAAVPADQLLQIAYTAPRSERIEVSCNDTGAVGFEHHDPM